MSFGGFYCYSGFQDSHLWFSVASRQAQSNFTSVQRLSCCLALLMTYMLANIMFYGVDSEPGEAEMDVGFLSMSWTEIRIGLAYRFMQFTKNTSTLHFLFHSS